MGSRKAIVGQNDNLPSIFAIFHQVHFSPVLLSRNRWPEYKIIQNIFQPKHYNEDTKQITKKLINNKFDNNFKVYNLGTGNARTFYDLANATFKALDLESVIEFVDTPEDIRDKYQYFTEANMNKIKKAGFNSSITSLEEGVADYVKNYLLGKQFMGA